MAIQFACPNCSAQIKTPDEAAGKRGTCPQCKKPLLVPQVAAPPTSGTTAPSPPGGSTAPAPPISTAPPNPTIPPISVGAPRQPTAPAPAAPPAPELPLPEIQTGPTSVSQALKQKQRTQKQKSKGALVVPILCLAAFVGAIGYLLWVREPALEGPLAAVPMIDLEVQPVTLPKSYSGLPEAEVEDVLQHLEQAPMSWESRFANMTLTGTKDGVVVDLKPGVAAEIVQIDPTQSAALRTAIQKHANQWEQDRLRDLKQESAELFKAWQDAFSGKTSSIDSQRFRDNVGYAALVTGLGFHLEATTAENKAYRCVYEDSAGKLYFLLPKGVKKFDLRGRKTPGGSSITANFHVTLGEFDDGKDGSASKKPLSAEEQESQNLGMNPDLYEKPEDSQSMEGEGNNGSGGAIGKGLGLPLQASPNSLKDKKPSDKSGMMKDAPEMMEDMPEKPKPGTPPKPTN